MNEVVKVSLRDETGHEVWRGDAVATDAGYVPLRPLVYSVWRRVLHWRRLP